MLITDTNVGRNKIINGAMAIWQRGTAQNSSAATQFFIADRWKYVWAGPLFGVAGTPTVTLAQDTSVPPVGPTTPLFPYSLKMTVSGGATAGASFDQIYLQYCIEGYDWAMLAQRDFTVSFWVKAHRTGVYSFGLADNGASATFTAQYTINVADTWQYVAITVPASPATGAWGYTNGVGLRCMWVIACGTACFAKLNSWQVANYPCNASQVPGVSATSDTFSLAGVQIEEGLAATAFECRLLQTELAMCQRYYEKSFPFGTTPGNGIYSPSYRIMANAYINGACGYGVPFKVTKRTSSSTMTKYDANTGTTAGQWARQNNVGAWTVTGTTTPPAADEFGFGGIDSVAGGAEFQAYDLIGNWTASCEL